MHKGLLSVLLVAGLGVAAPVLGNGLNPGQDMGQAEAAHAQTEADEPMVGHAVANGLDGTAWRVVLLDDTALLPDDEVTIAFADGRVAGRSACNRYTGGFEAGDLQTDMAGADTPQGGAEIAGLAFGALASTRMACQGRAATLEEQFLAALDRIDGYQLADDGMLHLFAGSALLITAEQTDPAAP
ncbi:MAG: META domain-containing protein [Pararhodobacter sp.]|nr:META domain-containing protein [Pararhodobacter sp.]